MNLPRISLGVAVLALVVALAGWAMQWRATQELRGAFAALESRSMGVPSTGSRTEGGSGAGTTSLGGAGTAVVSGTEIAQMRDNIEKLKTRTQALGRMALQQVANNAPLDLRPASAWKNAGRGTPSAAIETLFWASDGGEVETLAASILLEPDAREKALALLARLPDAVRAQYDTPEKFIALFMAREGDARAMQVLTENISGNDALVNVRAQRGDGKTKEDGYVFRRSPDGWRLVVPAKSVDKFGNKLTKPDKKKG
jgi:hypothetical protein